jgi:transcription elongation factor GreA
MPTTVTAPELLRAVGLLPDGPVPWGQPVPAKGPGVYVVELPAPQPTAPIELTRVGKWIERVPDLRLDGERPTSRALAARLAAYWRADQGILFVGSAPASVGGRVGALRRTVIGDRRPYAGGHWLHTLRGLERALVWWAATDAPEEYEDALLDAYAAAAGVAPSRPEAGADDPVLPWAVLRRPTGERRAHGIGGALLPEPVEPAVPAMTVRVVDPAEAPAVATPVGGAPRAPRTPRPPRDPAARRPTHGADSARPGDRDLDAGAQPTAPIAVPGSAGGVVELSREGHDRMQAELHELRVDRRPATIKRVATARELGDLRENAEYHSAREELGFIEGRIRSLEARLRNAVILEASSGDTALLGSTVTVEIDGERLVYRLVSTAEADPSNGRISTSSPVGRALLGRVVGDEVVVRMPAGHDVRYRVVEVS